MRSSFLRTLWAGAAAGALLVAAAGPAGALDEAKPTPCNGLAYSDPADDSGAITVPAAATTPATELTGGFLKYDAAKGDEATTYNLVVKELTASVPDGYTTVSWVAYYPGADGGERWVRAVADFGDNVEFEYGRTDVVGPRQVSIYEGDTPGKMFEGPEGVVQLVVPKDHAKEGQELKPLYANTLQGQTTLPPSTDAPTRGTSWVMDSAPDDEAEAGVAATVKACPAESGGGAPPPPPSPPSSGNPAPPPPSSGTPTGNRSLPVALLTKSLRTKAVRKKARLKLRSSEPIRNLAAQLRKGRKVVGRGSLKSLDGTGTLVLKARKPKRGRYTLDLAGDDAGGKRLLTSHGLRIR